MSGITKLSDAFWSRTKKGDSAVYLFWSRDWYTVQPWTLDQKQIPYFSKHVETRPIGRMTSWFAGPLLIVTYKMNKENQ